MPVGKKLSAILSLESSSSFVLLTFPTFPGVALDSTINETGGCANAIVCIKFMWEERSIKIWPMNSLEDPW